MKKYRDTEQIYRIPACRAGKNGGLAPDPTGKKIFVFIHSEKGRRERQRYL